MVSSHNRGMSLTGFEDDLYQHDRKKDSLADVIKTSLT